MHEHDWTIETERKKKGSETKISKLSVLADTGEIYSVFEIQ